MTKRLFILFLFKILFVFAQVGIGTTTPNPSAMLEVSSTNKGVLIPRMTVSQRLAINNPTQGLILYQTNDIIGFYYYNGTSWVRLLESDKDANPVGTIITFPMETVPNGYLECNGQAVSRTTYANLFSVIGIRYGNGDGSTTFNLPNYRGQFLRGYDNGAGTDPDAATRTDSGNGTTGDAVGTKQNNQVVLHNHSVNPPPTNTNTSGDHNHNINPPNTYSTYSGNHNHLIDPPNTYTAFAGNHRHSTGLLKVGGYNTPSRPAKNTYKRYGKWHPNTYQYTDFAGNHRHTVNIAPFYSSANGSHRHTLDIPPFNSGNSGNHNHSIDIPSFNSSNTGGNETRPKNITVMYCIKY